MMSRVILGCQRITALAAFYLPAQPRILRLLARYDLLPRHTFFAAFQPRRRVNYALTRCDDYLLAADINGLFALGCFALVAVTAVLTDEVGWRIYQLRSLADEEAVYVKVGADIYRVHKNVPDTRALPRLAALFHAELIQPHNNVTV